MGEDRRGNWCLRPDGYYHCFRCKVKGWLPGTAPDDEDREFDPGAVEYVPGRQTLAGEADEVIGAPAGFVRLTEREDEPEVKRAIRYCGKRGISRSTALGAHLGTCLEGDMQGRVVVPVLRADGRAWAGWVARQIGAGRPKVPGKYRTPEGMDTGKVLFNQQALDVETSEPLMVCEGVFDALPYFPHAVACLGKPKEAQIELLLDTRRPLVITLDGDAWFEGRMLAIRLEFMGLEQPVGWVRLPPNTDPNSVTRAWLRTECHRAIAKSTHVAQNPGTNAL